MTLTPEQQYQQSWLERQDYAERMQPLIGNLISQSWHRNLRIWSSVSFASTIDIIKSHKTVSTL